MNSNAEKKLKENDNPNQGHRTRLKDRFMKGGIDSLADYELLELLLFNSRPRIDVKPIAKALLKKFGSFSEVISASPTEILEVEGVGEKTVVILKTVQASAHKLGQEQILNKTILTSWKQVLAYCRSVMAYNKIEEFRILFLDHQNNLIKDEVQQRGTIDKTPVYPREVVKRALELSASSIILFHNHPSGDPTPSAGDIKLTDEIIKAANALGVLVHDHIIITKSGHSSFKSLGII